MRILVSNDDGYLAPGLSALVKALQDLGEVTVVAPEQNRSGASNSLTLDRPLSLEQAENGFYFVDGTPTDCVHLAVTGLLPMPDIIVSGINRGANMGDDVLYSGTVAAATEGYLLGIPSVAFSLEGEHHFDFLTAAKFARNFVERLVLYPPSHGMLLNINIPPLASEQIKGIQITRLGKRHKAQAVIPTLTPRGKTAYWIGAVGKASDGGEGTDFYAVEQGYISVTPLQTDLTHHRLFGEVENWLKD